MEPEEVPFQLLEEITDGFSEDRKLGEGAFGVVYKGLTKNGDHVAVKILRDTIADLGHKQFQNEFYNLTKLQHENIVRLYGYCYQIEQKSMEFNGIQVLVEETHRALCLEYMHNGSLQKHLSDEFSGLDWNTRYKIIKGTCEGLKHMHDELEKPLHHLDLKPANILLDKNMVPKLADFGLSRIFGDKELTRTTKSPLGTLGYQPPEYIDRGEISKKFDIFSLGVLMIQIISGPDGYHTCANMPGDKFIDLVKTNWRIRLQDTSSDSMFEAYCHQVETCTQIALNCVEQDTQKRLDISKIVHKLNQLEADSGKGPQKTNHKPFPKMTIDEMMKMRMESNDITHKKQDFNNLMTSSSYDEVEFANVRENSLDMGEEFIVGRKEEKRKIMASLLQSMKQQITILPIYGIGGIGKTTFAKLIYNDTCFKSYSRVWASVSPIFDLNKVGNFIISQLSGKESQIDEVEMIRSCLMELLFGKKKILIILDDLWENNLFELNNLKDMLNLGDSINTIVLVTTRSKHVADNISTNVEPYQIKPLTNDMCWDIIKQKSSFEARDDKEQLMDIGKEIALKCRGVALAAQSLGFMLQPMKLDQWMEVKDSEIWNEYISEDATLPNHVLASLKLSCTKMSPCLMSCFTYCAVFPKGHEIIKEDLIHQWISLSFIKPTKLLSGMQLCEKYIVQLLGLSFLQHPVSPKLQQDNSNKSARIWNYGVCKEDQELWSMDYGGQGTNFNTLAIMAILEALDRMTPVSGSSTVVSPENFIKCLKKFYSHWKEDVYGLWGSPGAIAVATPPYSDDIRYRKSLALSMWFFGRDFADTIMVFLSSQIHFLSGQDGCDLLEHLKMPVSKAVGLDIVLHNIEKAGNGSLSMDQILNSVCAQYESNCVVMGHIAREKPEGKVLEEWYQKLHGSRLKLCDVSGGISELLSVKDASEIMYVKKAAYLTASVMKKYVVPKLENIVMDEKKVPHSKLMDLTEKTILSPTKINVKLKAGNVDICYPPIFQSGGKYDLRPGALSNDDDLHYDSWKPYCVCDGG